MSALNQGLAFQQQQALQQNAYNSLYAQNYQGYGGLGYTGTSPTSGTSTPPALTEAQYAILYGNPNVLTSPPIPVRPRTNLEWLDDRINAVRIPLAA